MPILVRPVREQLEHDRIIRLLQARYQKKHDPVTNIGHEPPTSIVIGTAEFVPDLILVTNDKARKLDSTVSRATVYRTLTLLVECGLLREVDLGRDQTYYDPNFLDKPQHNHLICLDCDRVVEFEDDHTALLHDCITRRLGFQPSMKSMRIEAHCDELMRLGKCTYRDAQVAKK